MNKAELIRSVATASGVSYEVALKMIDAFQSAIESSLIHGDEVSIRGFGKFVLSEHAARYYHDPLTGEIKMARAYRTVRFGPSAHKRIGQSHEQYFDSWS